MNVSEKEFEFMKGIIIRDMTSQLVSDFDMGFEQALDAVYESETFEKLGDPETGLYYQSPLYVYSYLKEEIENGRMS